MQKTYKAGDMLHPEGYKHKTSFLAKGASEALLTTNPRECLWSHFPIYFHTLWVQLIFRELQVKDSDRNEQYV